MSPSDRDVYQMFLSSSIVNNVLNGNIGQCGEMMVANTASIWISPMQACLWSLGHSPSLSPQPHGHLSLSFSQTHRNTVTHTALAECDCITPTAAGLSFINVSFRGVICSALCGTVIIQVICWKMWDRSSSVLQPRSFLYFVKCKMSFWNRTDKWQIQN